MKYKKFIIHHYKGIKKDLIVPLENGETIMAIIGLNECGKSSILKAILAFDYLNDTRYKQENHLKDLVNYYQTDMLPELSVSAEIKLENDDDFKRELFEYIVKYNCYEEFGIETKIETSESGEEKLIIPTIESNEFVKQYKSFLSKDITITRTYSNLDDGDEFVYRLEHEKFSNLSEEFQHDLSEIIIKYLPICNYLHSRNDIEDEITICEENKNRYWNVIFNNLFLKALNKKLTDVAANSNRNIKESDIEIVKNYLNNEFVKAWNELGRDENFTESIDFDLTIEEESGAKKLFVSLKEKINGNLSSNSFKLANRSDGFQWYYSFIMQLLFNPIVKGEYNKSVLFLLDEPGMYLNPVAQISLLKRFVEIVKDNNQMQIIYTTHSHHMLNTDYLNPYQVFIAEKDKSDLIKLYNLKNYPYKKAKLSALSPLFDSLQVPFDERVLGTKKVILVEGIHDFYALDLFCDFDNSYYIYPCVGATTIEKNIAFFIMLKTQYVYLVDNDYEGVEKAIKSIEDHYEKDKGIYLPFNGYMNIETNEKVKSEKYEMDNVFDEVLTKWCQELGLSNANYERLIEYMYFNKSKSTVKALLKDNTIKAKFTLIKNKILEKFK